MVCARVADWDRLLGLAELHGMAPLVWRRVLDAPESAVPPSVREDARARFYQEARAATALDHPNICTIYEIDEDDGQIFIAMAYVEGVAGWPFPSAFEHIKMKEHIVYQARGLRHYCQGKKGLEQ